MKFLLWLLGGSLFALIVMFVLAGIATSGVQSLSAAMVFLWIAFGIFAFCLLVAGIRVTANLDGGKATLVTLLLVGLLFGGLWARSGLGGWLTKKKATEVAARQLPPTSAPKPLAGQVLPTPSSQSLPAPKGVPGGVSIKQRGKGSTANPGTNTGPVNVGNCGVFQNGGSNNTASPNCAPPPVSLSYRILLPAEATHFEATPGFIKTEIEIVPDQAVTPPFQIALDFDNPVEGIGSTVVGVGAQLGGGRYSVGRHASTTVLMGIGPANPLVVVVTSHVPVRVLSTPQITH
jgi:hypothetical protein